MQILVKESTLLWLLPAISPVTCTITRSLEISSYQAVDRPCKYAGPLARDKTAAFLRNQDVKAHSASRLLADGLRDILSVTQQRFWDLANGWSTLCHSWGRGCEIALPLCMPSSCIATKSISAVRDTGPDSNGTCIRCERLSHANANGPIISSIFRANKPRDRKALL